jgi:CHAT domain-containing protein/tetratricopeptide (TPR) repeat protein
LLVVERLAELSTLFGLFAAANDLLDGMVELCERAGNYLGSDYARLKRTELALARGRPHDAYTLLRELKPRLGELEEIDLTRAGLVRWEREIGWQHYPAADRTVLLTRAYLVMGEVLASLGHYAEAIGVLERGGFHAEHAEAPDLARQSIEPLGLRRAAALLEYGDLDAAETSLKGLVRRTEDNLAPAGHTRHMELAGKLDLLRGRFGSAVRNFESIIDFCERRSFQRASATARLNLAHALVPLNRVGEALSLAARVHAYAEEAGDQSLALRAAALINVALARRRSPASAVSVALSVKEMVRNRRVRQDPTQSSSASAVFPPAPQSDNFLAFFEDRALEFQWMLRVDPDDAEKRLDEMQQTFRNGDSRLIEARLHALQGFLAFVRDEFDAALGCFKLAAERFGVLSLQPELWQALYRQARCLARLGRDTEAARIAESAEAILLNLAGSLDGDDRTIFLLNKATIEEEYIGTQLDTLLREQLESKRASFFSRWFARMRIARRLHAIMEHVDVYKAGRAEKRAAGERTPTEGRLLRRVSLLRRMLAMPRDRAQLSFLVLPDRLFVMWSGFLTMGFAVNPITRLDLRERVRTWHELMQRSHQRRKRDIELLDETSDSQTADLESGAIIDGLADVLRIDSALNELPDRVRRLAIVPDDVLHGVPFAALKYRDRYLVERYAISVGFTTRRTKTKRAPDTRKGFVVGVSRGSDGLEELPQVLAETANVSDWFAKRGLKVETLVNDSASLEAVVSGFGDASIAHIACHGTFEPSQPEESGLELIPAVGRRERLAVRVLAGLDLAACRHVTLSSCWSADNFIIPGRWIISLPETLWRSGADSVLGSLWAVDDDVAVEFTSRFYRGLERVSREQALREVQLASIKCELDCKRGLGNRPIDTSAPAFWAGFSLYGDGDRLKL